ncbi:hypothetical protein D3C78_1811610 [compost metagenome]
MKPEQRSQRADWRYFGTKIAADHVGVNKRLLDGAVRSNAVYGKRVNHNGRQIVH